MLDVKITLSDQHSETLERLKKILGLTDNRDLINAGLSVLQWMTNEASKGNHICSLDPLTKKVLRLKMPLLDRIEGLGRGTPN